MLSTSSSWNDNAQQEAINIHRKVILPLALLLCIAALMLAVLMLVNASILDRRSAKASILAIKEGLNTRLTQLDRVVKDYAWWNEAYAAIQVAQDRHWAEIRLGKYLYSTHQYDWAFVVAADDSTFYAALQGEAVEDDITGALGHQAWKTLAARARQALSGDEPKAVHSFIRLRESRLGMASAAAIWPESTWNQPIPSREPYVLIVVRGLTEEWLAELTGALELKDLTFSTEPLASSGVGLHLLGPNEEVTGSAIWRPRQPGTDYLVALAPPLGSAVILLIAFGWSLVRQSRSSAIALS